MKKQYQKPTMHIVRIEYQYQHIICTSVTGTEGPFGYGGGGSGPARARQHGGIDWDDWDE